VTGQWIWVEGIGWIENDRQGNEEKKRERIGGGRSAVGELAASEDKKIDGEDEEINSMKCQARDYGQVEGWKQGENGGEWNERTQKKTK
jgi:hypothetical protein